jgi:hypothetical protein
VSGLADHKILGLTVRRPWAELIAQGIKTIENRSWAPPAFMLGRYLAIHASPMWDQEGEDFIRRNHPRFAVDPPPASECPHGIIAVAQLVGWVQRGPENDPRPRTVAMLEGHAFGKAEDPLGHSIDWRWFVGAEYGWVLRNVKRFSPVAVRGRQKLWALPPLVYESVKRHWAKAA